MRSETHHGNEWEAILSSLPRTGSSAGLWRFTTWMLVVFSSLFFAAGSAFPQNADAIRPYSGNPWYWQYKGRPVLLLGGSWQDNLFNHPNGLEDHLDLLTASGGNYVRNTMSHRDEGNLFPYARLENGKFDLDQWNPEFWERFDNFLKLTHQRDIIVQIEIWATHDYSNAENRWPIHPFNPANNITYTAGESGLPTQSTSEPSKLSFFHTVPEMNNNTLVLRYQQALVDKLLSYSLAYPHVLYCMNNETRVSNEWGDYWVDYVRERAQAKGVEVHVTDMRWDITIQEPDNIHIYDRPDRYTFVDISQVSAHAADRDDQWRYDRILSVRKRIAKQPRPMNQTKIYNGTRGDAGLRKMCVSLFAGCASARFHRPLPANWMRESIKDGDYEASSVCGFGLSQPAQTTIRSLRMLTDAMNIFVCEPRNDLLSDRSSNEAYCLAEPGRQYAVYFPDGGSVTLDLSAAEGNLQMRWLDIVAGEWVHEDTVDGGGDATLTAPGDGDWAVVISAE